MPVESPSGAGSGAGVSEKTPDDASVNASGPQQAPLLSQILPWPFIGEFGLVMMRAAGV